ncbi:hypothetical protein [uncultured Methylobacterium sp.]|uniref:hypothetical protein n=1 Tax=uncultured Methylobacterium sp. TaxID=157278 RepID=UPI0035CA8CBC
MPDVGPIDLPGRVLLPDGTERDCRVRCDEADRLEIVLDAAPSPGTRVLCHVSGLGAIEGVITVEASVSRRLDVRATPRHAARLAARMAWHRRMAAGHEDQRGHMRIVPRRTETSPEPAHPRRCWGPAVRSLRRRRRDRVRDPDSEPWTDSQSGLPRSLVARPHTARRWSSRPIVSD